jgi:hypothetical protein
VDRRARALFQSFFKKVDPRSPIHPAHQYVHIVPKAADFDLLDHRISAKDAARRLETLALDSPP